MISCSPWTWQHEVEEAGSQVVGTFYSALTRGDAAAILAADIAIVDLQLEDGDSGLSLATHLAALGCKVIVVSGRR